MSSGFLPQRVIQVHPTVACNLRCRHCYSNSGPGAGTGLPADRLLTALRALHAEGYDVLSISGGEPLAYRQLDRLVVGAAAAGYRVNLVTNGTLLTDLRLERIAEHLALVAVSLDGDEGTHNWFRSCDDGFARALLGMGALQRAGVRFGVALTVSRRAIGEIPAVYEQCVEQGASQLSLRPLAHVGRATELASETLTQRDLARMFVLAQLLDGAHPQVRVRTDVAPSEWLSAGRDRHAVLTAGRGTLSELVNPLVIDETGRLAPYAYGVAPAFGLGDIDDIGCIIRSAHDEGLPAVTSLTATAFDNLDSVARPYVDWYAHLAEMSCGAARQVPVSITR